MQSTRTDKHFLKQVVRAMMRHGAENWMISREVYNSSFKIGYTVTADNVSVKVEREIGLNSKRHAVSHYALIAHLNDRKKVIHDAGLRRFFDNVADVYAREESAKLRGVVCAPIALAQRREQIRRHLESHV